MKKIYAAAVALVLGLGGAVAVAESASAHNHTDVLTCGVANVSLTQYDQTATVKITLDGVVVQDTTPFGGIFHYNQPLTYDADHPSHTMIVEVLSQDPGYSFTHTDTSPAECYTPPVVGRDVLILPVVVHPATCDAGVTYDVPTQDADVKYDLGIDGNRPVPGTGFSLPAGQVLTISAHVTAANLVVNGGKDNPNSYTVTLTGGDSLAGTQECAPPLPETKVVYGDWTDGNYACGDTTQQQTRTVETTTYAYDESYNVTSSTKESSETRTVDLTAEQVAALECPVVTPTPTPTPTVTPVTPVGNDTQLPNVLAHTGVDGNLWLLEGGVGALIFLLGVISVSTVVLIRRKKAASE